jgi:hypothetical protein
VTCECCVVRGLCDGPIARPEESYRVWCDRKTSTMTTSWPTTGYYAVKKLRCVQICW